MAYQTGTTNISTIEELMQTLNTFLMGLTGPGWVTHELDTGANRMYMQQGTQYIGFQWSDTVGRTDRLWTGHATGVTVGQPLGAQPGNTNQHISNDPTVSLDEHTNMVQFHEDPPFVRYHFFASEVAPYYCHVVVEQNGNVFKHFGFGNIEKFNDWTGGEYMYTHNVQSSSIDEAHDSTSAAVGIDGSNFFRRCWSMRCPDFIPGGDPSQVWALGNTSTSITVTDEDGNPFIRAVSHGWRGGGYQSELGWLPQSNFDSMRMLFPIEIFLEAPTNINGQPIYYAGRQPDVRSLNMANFLPGDEITIGTDVWMIFPTSRKQVSATLADGFASRNQGIAFLKNAA